MRLCLRTFVAIARTSDGKFIQINRQTSGIQHLHARTRYSERYRSSICGAKTLNENKFKVNQYMMIECKTCTANSHTLAVHKQRVCITSNECVYAQNPMSERVWLEWAAVASGWISVATMNCFCESLKTITDSLWCLSPAWIGWYCDIAESQYDETIHIYVEYSIFAVSSYVVCVYAAGNMICNSVQNRIEPRRSSV